MTTMISGPARVSAYPALAAIPTQAGPLGIRFDFNQGARIALPPLADGETPWKFQIRDLDTGNILFESENRGAFVSSSKIFYVRFRLEVWLGETRIFEHDLDCGGRDVLIQFPVGTLGDSLAWFPYAERFREKHGCRLTCAMSEAIIPLVKDANPDINFVTHAELEERKLSDTFYATYSMGLFFDDVANNWQPYDFRHVGLHRTAGHILGVDPSDTPARIVIDRGGPPIPEPYVCIAVQASSGCKKWQNPTGWMEVVDHLKALGYRVICIDREKVHGANMVYNYIPYEAENQTGDRPLTERARWLKHACAFVGLSSGLSWLAWSAGVPVVMISGFTWPTNEFPTDFRVINKHTCNGCWNDPKERFSHTDYLWCPRHQGTERQFECTRLITGTYVNSVIDQALKVRGEAALAACAPGAAPARKLAPRAPVAVRPKKGQRVLADAQARTPKSPLEPDRTWP